jgi:GalNAc-alpha-(1->4)-GalNAc-alpha-(1->3)-diNAcBac-PP-undecaprenol alpha-1,4-N-acetyl-D-galactosaminyltransferase
MEQVMAQLAENFSRRVNTQVDLILIGKKREIVYPLPDTISIHRPSFRFDESRRMMDTLRTIRFLRSKVKEIDPDVVLSFGEYWNNMVLLALYGLSHPVYISDRSQPDKDLGTIQNFLRNRLYPKATGYIAQTEEAKKVCLRNKWNRNIRVIGNPIRKIKTNGSIPKENIILTVGRLIKTKHVDQLINIFAEIDNSEWKLVIVGGDSKKQNLSKELKKLVRELNVEKSVFLEGEQENIETYYKKSKIFAFTSSSEGFPNVIGEAMSAGLPVVSYNCIAGPSDMITDGVSGYLVPVLDQEEFKQKLHQLMMDEELRNTFGRKAQELIQRYNIERIADQFYHFITESTSREPENIESRK